MICTVSLDYDRRYEIIANAQPNLTNLDVHFWNSKDNKSMEAAVFLIKNLKKLEKFRVHLWPIPKQQFLDENVLISQESTERPTLKVKFLDDLDNRDVEAVKVNKLPD